MKFLLHCLAMLLLSVQPLHAAAILTLDEALETALKNHPQLVEAKENLRGAQAGILQAHSTYYPQISIAADWSKGRSFLTAQESIRSTEVASAAIYLKQTIYDFGRTSGSVEASRQAGIAASQALAVTRQDLALRVRASYYLLLAAEKQVVSVRETVAAREAVFRQAGEFFSQGIRAKVDLTKAEANLYGARTLLIRAENNRDIAWLDLSSAMGVPLLENRLLEEPASAPESVPERDQARQQAFASRPDLKRLDALSSSAAASLKSARSGHFPLLAGAASAGYAGRDFPPGGNVWAVGLNLTIPLFSGFSTVAQTREARATVRAIEAQQNNLKLQITRDVETARLGVIEAGARIASTGKELLAARENRELAMGRYREGVGTIIEVSDAQSQSLEAETSNIQAIYDYHGALARLQRAIGKE